MKNEIILSVLNDVREKLELSDLFFSCGTDSPYFGDSVKVAEARYTVSRLIDAIKLFNEYAKD